MSALARPLLALLSACVCAGLWFLAGDPGAAEAGAAGPGAAGPGAAVPDSAEPDSAEPAGAPELESVAPASGRRAPVPPERERAWPPFTVRRGSREGAHGLAGRVIDATRLGVAGQRVRLLPEQGDPREQETDALGYFSFQGLERGSARLAVLPGPLPAGWLAPCPSRQPPGVAIEVPGEDPVELRLLRAATVFGRVRLADGTPVEGVRVRLDSVGSRGRHSLAATTDAGGNFEAAGAYPLRYTARLDSKRDFGLRARPRALELEVLEGGVTDAGELVLGGGPAALAGRLVDPHGQPFEGLEVVCYYAEGSGFWDPRDEAARVRTDAEGRFQFEGLAASFVYLAGGDLWEAIPVDLAAGDRRVLPDQIVELGPAASDRAQLRERMRRPGYLEDEAP